MKNKIETLDVNFWYGDFHALKGISMDIEEKSVIAFIGPSGCGKYRCGRSGPCGGRSNRWSHP